MSLETSVDALTNACNSLTQEVAGKMGVIDAHLQASTTSINNQLEATKLILPRILMTKNQTLEFDTVTNLPLGFALESTVTATIDNKIEAAPMDRTPIQNEMLQAIETDTGCDLRKAHHYRHSFNIMKLSWTAISTPRWLAYPNARDSDAAVAVPSNTYFTIGAFVKLLSGSISSAWANGAELGKWRFCSQKMNPRHFGSYIHLHPHRGAEAGSLLVALPAAVTGHVDSGNNWFPNIAL